MTTETDHEKKAAENNRDYNNEIAGLDTGRIKRFLSEAGRDSLEEGESGKSRRGLSFLDILLLTDPGYARLYADVIEKIEEIDKAVTRTLASLDQRIDALEKRMTDIQGRAYQLSDGTRVYQSKDGDVYAEDGDVLSQQETSGIAWQSHNPSWEEYSGVSESLDRVQDKKGKVEAYRDGTLQEAKERMSDPDNLPDKDELQNIFDDLDSELPEDVELSTHNADVEPVSTLVSHFEIKTSGQEDTLEATSTTPEHVQSEHTGSSPLDLNPMRQI